MNMKDSGVRWLGSICDDWTVAKVKHAFDRKNEKAQQDAPVVLSLARSGVKERDISNNEGQLAESYYNYNPVDIDDLLLNPMDLYSGANCSISKVKGVISPAYFNLRAKSGYNPRFYDYYFKVQYWMMAFFAHGSGVSFENRWTITNETLQNYPILVPPSEQQTKIADYLDSKCSKIDEVIQTQQKIIEKLKEYKQAVITEAVDNPSYTKWNLGYLSTCKNGLNYVASEAGEKYKFLNVGDFQDYFVLDKEEMFSDIITTTEIDEDYYLQSGDIVFVRSNGSKELVGRAIMVENINFPVTYSGFCIRLRNIRKDIVDSKYLLYFFRSFTFRNDLTKYSQGSNISNINQDLLSHIKIAIPALEKQKEIVEELNRRCKAIDESIEKKQQIIEKLTAYKKSLIYECVTGKREVK